MQRRGRWQRFGFNFNRGQYWGRDIFRLHLDMRLRSQHVRVLWIQLLDARSNVFPEWRPEEHVVVVASWLTPRRNKTCLRSTNWPSDLEKILHLHRRLSRILFRVIFVELLQPIEVLSAQQRVQFRGLLKIQDEGGRKTEFVLVKILWTVNVKALSCKA